MALKGATYFELELMCKRMKLSPTTTRSYLQEVAEDLKKLHTRNNNK